MIAAFLTTILFSISAVLAARSVRYVGGTEANFWRLVFAALVLAGYAHSRGGGLTGAALPLFLIGGGIGFGLGDAAYFQALPRLGSRLTVMMILCLSAPLAALIEWLWLGTSLQPAEIGAALTILAGVAVALAPGHASPVASGKTGAGVCFGLVATVCQAGGAVLSRKAYVVAQLAGEDIDGVTAAYQRLLGGLVVMAFFWLIAKRRVLAGNLFGQGDHWRSRLEAHKSNWRRAWPLVLLTGLFGPALGVSCFQWALKSTPTGIVLPIVAITPIVIIPFSRYVEGERPTMRSLAGSLLAVVGAIVLAWASN